MNNSFNFTMPKQIPAGRHYIEDICSNYGDFFSRLHLKMAIFNMSFFIIYTILKRFEDEIIINLHFETGYNFKVSIGDINNVFFNLALLLNFFYFGYWLLDKNITFARNIPVLRWFVT